MTEIQDGAIEIELPLKSRQYRALAAKSLKEMNIQDSRQLTMTPKVVLDPAHELLARNTLVKIARWGVKNEPRIFYTESSQRDDWLYRAPFTLPLTTDCSGFVTLCYKWAHLPDPNGLSYHWLGNTATLLIGSQEIDKKRSKPGDFIVYGPGGGDHTAIIVGAAPSSGSVICVSHGWTGGPQIVTNLKEATNHNPPQRWMRAKCFAMPQ